MRQENWAPCPRCGSNRVQSRGILFFFLLGFTLTGISIWLLIIPPIGIAGIITGLLIMAFSPFTKGTLQCQDCNKAWKPKNIKKANPEQPPQQ